MLPVLWGSQFIGRIEAAADRKAGAFIVKNVWYENGVRQLPIEILIRLADYYHVSTDYILELTNRPERL